MESLYDFDISEEMFLYGDEESDYLDIINKNK